MNEKQHSIPQNIMSIQFKLIGNMSMRQFLIIATPLLIGFIMYVVKISNYITVPFTAIFVLLALAIAFVPIDDRPLDEWITNFIVAIKNPTQRVWKKNEVIPNILKIDRPMVNKNNNKKDVSMFLYQSPFDNSLNSVNEDAVDNALDVKEKTLIANIDKINSMISNGSTSGSTPPSNLGTDLFNQGSTMHVASDPFVASPNILSGMPIQDGNLQKDNLQGIGSISNGPDIPGAIPNTSTGSEDTKDGDKIPQYNPFNINNITPVSAAEEVRSSVNPNIRDDFINTQAKPETSNVGQIDNPFQDIVDQINTENTSPTQTIPQEQTVTSSTEPTTINKEEADVVQQDVSSSIDTKAVSTDLSSNTSNNTQVKSAELDPEEPDLKDLNPKDLNPTDLDPKDLDPTVAATTHSEGESREAELAKILTRIQALEEENQRLKTQLTEKSVSAEQDGQKFTEPTLSAPKSQDFGNMQTSDQESVQGPQIQGPQAQGPQAQGQPQDQSLIHEEKKSDNTPGNLDQTNQDQSIGLTRQQLIDHLPEFTKVANVVAGVVITDEDKILNNAIVIVKDTNQKPVRAVKTNQLGQFFTRTPLPLGRYEIEVDAAGYKFNTATIEISGQIIPPFMFIPVSKEEKTNISGI